MATWFIVGHSFCLSVGHSTCLSVAPFVCGYSDVDTGSKQSLSASTNILAYP
jgi:hypothetical protein